MTYKNSTGKNGFVYILSNYNRNVLYIDERIIEHKYKKGAEFTKKYNVDVLVYFEKYPNINEAIEREKQLKNWHREWKLNLIKKTNPDLKDLWEKL